MVLQHAHSFPHASSTDASGIHLDATRIAAATGAIALNVVVLLLLLIPAGMPDSVLQPDKGIIVVPIIDRIVPPRPPTKPEKADLVKPHTPVTSAAVKPDIVRPAIAPVVVDQGTLPAEAATTSIDTAPVDIAAPAGPVQGVQLEYAQAPSPPYPREALLAGMQGTVLLRVLVDVDGRPLKVEIERGSGHRELDDAARRFVLKRWSFRPAMKDGQAVQAIGLVPIDFNLG